MFQRLTSSNSEFRSITFQKGFNLLIAEKGESSTDGDSRNGAGKSSVIEVLHFLLGLQRLTDSVLRKKALADYSFTLEMDWDGVAPRVCVTRSLVKKSNVKLEPNVVEAEQLVTSAGTASNTDWVEAIGQGLFNLPTDHAGISVRGLLSLYMRRDSQKAFTDPIQTFPRQPVTEASANLAFLLGLDWRQVVGYQGIAARERLRRELTKATKDPVFGLVVGSVAELRGQVAAATKRRDELEAQLNGFTVVPEYEVVQHQADVVDEEIRSSRMRDAADRRNLQDLEKTLDAHTEPESEYVAQVYRSLKITLPEIVKRTYEEVRIFHESVTRNRRAYLEVEIQSTRQRLSERAQERERLGEEHSQLLSTLSEGGALDAYTQLALRLSTAQAELETLGSRLGTAKRLEATRSELKMERLALSQGIARDLEERAAQVEEINLLFQRFAASLYSPDREAYVEIEPLETSLRIRPHIGGEDSRGIGQMTMFCFDLTWAVIAHRAGRGPDFLVHDSHLFDGVDERQVARAFKLVERVCAEEGMQYVATMNSDDLAKATNLGFDPSPHLIEPRFKDSDDDGGLFGIKFM